MNKWSKDKIKLFQKNIHSAKCVAAYLIQQKIKCVRKLTAITENNKIKFPQTFLIKQEVILPVLSAEKNIIILQVTNVYIANSQKAVRVKELKVPREDIEANICTFSLS